MNINKKIRSRLVGTTLSKESKENLARSIREKVKAGTWHNSFSKSRTHDYNGIKLYGLWELAYAKYLDTNNIKWRRPKEKFYYEFEGSGHYYTPDFYLIDEDIYIEIKGYKTKKDDAKWQQFPLKLKVYTGKELFEMHLIDSYKIIPG